MIQSSHLYYWLVLFNCQCIFNLISSKLKYKQNISITQLKYQTMGKTCSVCQFPKTQQLEPGQIGNINDPDEPQRQYAYPQIVKYIVSCDINHVFDQIPEQKLPEDLSRGKKYQQSYFLVPYKVYYTGDWKNGRPHGIGDVVFEDGTILKGSFSKGQVIGQDNILAMKDGSYYRGSIKNNALQGKGKFVQKNGHSYQGSWHQNVPHGFGIQKFANGDYYEGQYNMGKKKGQKGFYKWENHHQYIDYTGGFSDDYMNGQGTLHKVNGTTISGFFRQTGIQDAIVKSRQYQYIGQVKNGLLNGNGKIVYLTENRMYEGQFKDGLPHGQGTIILSNGTKKSGNWFKGNLVRSYKGLTDDQVEKCLYMIENQFQSKIYSEDAVQSINYDLKSAGYHNFVAKLIDNSEVAKMQGNKYLIVDMGNNILAITEKK